ncbi:MAG: xanthine dehydrogenase family protein subunit M, partial [SAR324 cluster bacterium]|nr:xanthine dehydrogenase family protein subunit M [SAR324 cluster bacterium]
MGDYAAAAVAVQLSLAADGSIEQAGIGLTNVAALPTRAVDAEKALLG